MAQDIRATDSGPNGESAPASARPATPEGTAPSARSQQSVEQRLQRLERQLAQAGRDRDTARKEAEDAKATLRNRDRQDQDRLVAWLSSPDTSDEQVGKYFRQFYAQQHKPEPDETTAERYRREGREAAAREATETMLAAAKKAGYMSDDEFDGFIERAQRGEATIEDLFAHGARMRNPQRQQAAHTIAAAEAEEVPSGVEGEGGEGNPPITPSALRKLKGTGMKGVERILRLMRDPAKAEEVEDAWSQIGPAT